MIINKKNHIKRDFRTLFKIVSILLLFFVLVSCQAKTPSSSNDSSKTTDTDTDTDTDITNYVGKWVKSSDNSIAMDWKSNDFVYACLVGTDYTFASHGSYSVSNTRLTWWDGSYNTVSPSGSNIILDGATYNPAILYSSCNPFWTYHTSENTNYTNATRSIGYWTMTFTIINTYTEYNLLATISSRQRNDGNYYTYGLDEYSNIINGTYNSSTGNYDILNTGSIIDLYFVFKINSSNNATTNGCYYQYSHSDSSWSSCFSMYGTKLYGSPSSYRKRNKYKSKEVIEKELEKEVKLESRQNIQRLTNADIEAFNSYQKLLLVLEDTEKSSLKSFLQSFNKN